LEAVGFLIINEIYRDISIIGIGGVYEQIDGFAVFIIAFDGEIRRRGISGDVCDCDALKGGKIEILDGIT